MKRNMAKAASVLMAAAVIAGSSAGIAVNANAASASGKSAAYVISGIKETSDKKANNASYSFSYNGNGFMSSQTVHNASHTGNNYVSRYTYTYKPWKFEIGSVTKYNSSKNKTFIWTYAYQTANKVKDYYRTTPGGTYVDKLQFTGRDGSRITSAKYTKYASSSSKGGTRTLKYSYDKSGNLVKDTILSGSGSVLKIRRFAYDSHGNVTRENDYNKNGKRISSVSYKNTYTKKGYLKRSVLTEKTSSGKTQKTTFVYTYKKISVPSSFKKYVKQQQKDKMHTINYGKQVTDVQ